MPSQLTRKVVLSQPKISEETGACPLFPLLCLLLNSQVSLHAPLPPAVKGCLPLHVFHLSTPRSYFFLHLCLSLSSVNFSTAFFNISFSPPISVEALSFHFLSQSFSNFHLCSALSPMLHLNYSSSHSEREDV